MGNKHDCYSPPPKILSHICNVPLNGYASVPNFCTLSGPAGDKYRRRMCDDVSSEYGGFREGVKCHYNDCDRMTSMGGGCCKHPAKCCGILGRSVDCKRTAFYGDPADCCLRNSSCARGIWTKPSECQDRKQFTCSDGRNGMPDHRTITGVDCRASLWDYFTGKNVDMETTISRWMVSGERGIVHFIERVIHHGANCAGTVAPDEYSKDRSGLVYASGLVRRFVERFNSEAKHRRIPSVKWSPGYHVVQDVLYKLALKYPIVADGVLYDLCSSMDVDDLAQSEDLTRWCGCHLRDHLYDPYERQYGLKKECSPMCTYRGTLPMLSGDGSPTTCTQSVCIVNNVAVRTSMSKVGDVSITQMCNHCKDKNSCRCVVDGVDISVNATDIDGSLKAVQELCTDTMCTVYDPENSAKRINIPCNGPDILYYQYQHGLRKKDSRESTLALCVCFVVGCILITILILRRL